MVGAYSRELMVINLRVNGRMIKWMEYFVNSGPMALNSLDPF